MSTLPSKERLQSLRDGLESAKKTYGCQWTQVPPFEMLDVCFQEIDRLRKLKEPALETGVLPELTSEQCPDCDTHEIDLTLTCHNSKCASYAHGRTVYEGWRNTQKASEGLDTG